MITVLIFAVNILSGGVLVADGQLTISCGKGSDPVSDARLEEHDRSVSTALRDLSARLQRSEDALRSIGRGIDSQPLIDRKAGSRRTDDQDAVEMLEERITRAMQENDQRWQGVYQNLSAVIARIDERLKFVFDEMMENSLVAKSEEYCRNDPEVCDCSEIKASGFTTNGVYRVYVVDGQKRHYAKAYCDMESSVNGSWLVFQRRTDGIEDFYRTWNEYANGFGDPSYEFWLGNEFLHLLTSKKEYRLRIDLSDFEGEKRFAEYSAFNVSSRADKYRINFDAYKGDAGDSLRNHRGMPFTTKDSDNDNDPQKNCAQKCHGGWWYNYCHYVNLNGFYRRGSYTALNGDGIVWHAWRRYWYSMKTTEMKIAPAN